ncbi:hypothetical protein T492DRAFT_1139035 [Pavlovales sp. CCMP2436]|nr:hypothetical protein T492DRAFT_1139035 [Pavlovales sp. CCMP2436]
MLEGGIRQRQGGAALPAPHAADWMLELGEADYGMLNRLMRGEIFRAQPSQLRTLRELVRTLAAQLQDDGDDTQTELTEAQPQPPLPLLRGRSAAASPVPLAPPPRPALALVAQPGTDALTEALSGLRLLPSLGAQLAHVGQALLADAALESDSRLASLAAALGALVPVAPATPSMPGVVVVPGEESPADATVTTTRAAAALTAAQQRLAALPAGTLPYEADCKSLQQARVATLRPLVEVEPGADVAAQLMALRAWALAKSKDGLGLLLTERVRELLDALRPGHASTGAKAPTRDQLLHMCLDMSFTPRARAPKRSREPGGGGEGGGSDDDDSEDEKSEGPVGEQGPAAGLYDVPVAAAAAKTPDNKSASRRRLCRLLVKVEQLSQLPGTSIHVALLAHVPSFGSLKAGKENRRDGRETYGTLVVGPYEEAKVREHFGKRGTHVIAGGKNADRGDENAAAGGAL